MHLDPNFTIWLNRAGIILNFLAGFMLAPELIGLARLQRAEDRIERTLQTMRRVSNQLTPSELTPNRVVTSDFMTVYSGIYFAILGSLLLLTISSGLDYLSAFLFVVVLIRAIYQVCIILTARIVKASGVPDGGLHRYALKNSRLALITTVMIILGLVLLPVTIPIMIMLSIVVLVELVILRFVRYLLDRMIGLMLGSDRLRSILIFWGILFFIGGNLLQFVATF